MLVDSLLPILFWAEAINTACCVQNKVLVTKAHNKTPYELLLGRSPSICFMRLFGCPVTILNTLDLLGKFDGKADEGFLVRYSVNSKTFRVFRIGPKWLFDIDTLTMSMNYQPVVAGNQPNDNIDIKENLDVGKVRKETVSAQQYVLLPLWSTGLQDPQNSDADATFDVKENEKDVYVSPSRSAKPKNHNDKAKRDDRGKSLVDSPTGVRDLRAEFEEFSINSTNRVNVVSAPVNAALPNPTNNTNSFNTTSPSDTAVNMPELDDIVYLDNKEDVGAEVDFFNLETIIFVSHIPTTRVHKDHPVTQIIGDLILLLKQEVWVMVDLLKGKRAIGSKWVFRNKKNEKGIVIRNKDRLVAQGHTQEEGIDYDEVFAPVARIKAIRLLLAYASFMGFMVYQMDVKSAFLYETIDEEEYVCQPLGFEDPDYLDKVYKVVKALYGLHQAPTAWYETLANYLLDNGFQRGKIDHTLFIKKKKGDVLLVWVYVEDIIFGSTNTKLLEKKDDEIFLNQDKYVAEISRMFGFTDVKSASTPIETEKPLLKDPDVKRIFRYLKGKPHLGLWYSKDSPFNLVAYSNSDYARASLDRKSTLGGCQFLGCRLIYWQCKKQTVVATSLTEAEYVVAASCCAQVLWIQN
nr:hypothetical protein [Tanacetum cinerariifolium]